MKDDMSFRINYKAAAAFALISAMCNTLCATVPDYINTWAILGTYPADKDPADILDPATVRPVIGQKIGEKTWQYFDDRLFSRNYDDYQDLYSYYSILLKTSVAGQCVYAHTWVYSPREEQAQLRLGADTSLRAWINGREVQGMSAARWHRDSAIGFVRLRSGWNQLLLRVSNQEEGRFGFYARFCNASGEALSDLVYSVNGPDEGSLKITTGGLTEHQSSQLPVAWKEWSYVEGKPDTARIEADPYMFGFNQNPRLLMHSSAFVLQAQGGRPPYFWNIAGGELPPGLTLNLDGSITGTVPAYAPAKKYTLTVCVEDADGITARREYTLAVQQRPNQWFDEARLVALMHAPETTPPDEIDDLMTLMKDQGYQLGMPICYHNGDMRYRWPSAYAGDRYTGKDVVALYKTALDKAGIRFGMYFGNLNEKDARFNMNQQVLMVREAIERYHPQALWCDWAGMDGESLDSLFSMIRTIDPGIVIVLNGYLRGSNGDWDEICFEGWTAWGDRMWDIWPRRIEWPKKHAPESWRLLTSPGSDKGPSDWREYLRVQISMIGEGFVADIDHSWGSRGIARLNDSPLVQYHRQMASWANYKTVDGAATAEKIPPLYRSYTLVNPSPLADARWGYSTVNLARDTVYLHIMKNPRGKTGLPAEPTLTVGPLSQRVKSAVWMNRNQPLAFTQNLTSTNQALTIDISSVVPDEIDTIVKLELESPIPGDQAPEPAQAVPAGNLATGKPARLLSLDGTRQLSANLGQLPEMAVDGNSKSAAAGGAFAWTYELDLQRLYSVRQIVITFASERFPTDLELQSSTNGITWKTLKRLSNDHDGKLTIDLEISEFRFLRVKAHKPDASKQPGNQMVIAELEVYGK